MRTLYIASVLGLVLASKCGAQTLPNANLSCIADGALSPFSIEIDFEESTLIHEDAFRYPITSVSDQFITAMGPDLREPGGTVWVIDRMTGHFVMSAAGKYCFGEDCDEKKVDSWVLDGHCQLRF